MTGDAPLLRVVRGQPSREELAVVVAVLAGRAAPAPATAPPRPVGAWIDRPALVRHFLEIGPGAWARSGRPPGTRTRAGW